MLKEEDIKMDYIKQRITKRLKSMTKISRVNRIGQKVRSLSACLNDRLTEDLNRISGPLWCRRKAGLMQKYVLAKIGQETIPTKAHCRLWDHYFELIRKSISRKKDFITQKFSKPCKGFGPWSSLWKNKEKLIKERSPYSSFDSLVIRPMIVKSGDDLRQESLALNLIRCMKSIFDRENCNLFIHPYDVIIKNHNSGFIEFIPDTISIDSLKKKYPMMDLNEIFREIFHTDFEACQLNFLRSLAGYSLVTYILKIKDRHNGNILMDAQGHIIHIDFGFMLSNSPGNWDFESAPFKLTEEYLGILGGTEGNLYQYFKVLLLQGFSALRKHSDEVLNILKIMSHNSPFPCFRKFRIEDISIMFGLNMSDAERENMVSELIETSMGSTKTYLYDTYQKYTNDIES